MKLVPPKSTRPLLLHGPAGTMEVLFDLPKLAAIDQAKGIAIVAHPQPLLGGSATHKVPQFLARGLCAAGWLVARPNFRGVGRSAGTHDGGDGEADDLLALCAALRDAYPGRRLALVGFSFGAYVQAHVASRLAESDAPAWRVALAGMPDGPSRPFLQRQAARVARACRVSPCALRGDPMPADSIPHRAR